MSATPEPTAHGLLIVDKPSGMTSHDVVARVRRLARTRKVGHAGTLDPMATGVLVLGVGRATRLLGHVSDGSKGYDATIRLGLATTTDDAEGEPLERDPGPLAAELDESDVRSAIHQFVGTISQVPSSVSAIKVNGRRAHALVRAGETVELASRAVMVESFDVLAVQRPDDAAGMLDLEVHVECSSGTYIRALARDLGDVLEVGGHLTALRRTRVAGWTLDDATSLDELTSRAELGPGALPFIDLSAAARRTFRCVSVDEAAARGLGFGIVPTFDTLPSGVVGVLGPDGELLALVHDSDGRVRPLVVFAVPQPAAR